MNRRAALKSLLSAPLLAIAGVKVMSAAPSVQLGPVMRPNEARGILVTSELLEDAAFDFDKHYRRGHFDQEHEIWELHAR